MNNESLEEIDRQIIQYKKTKDVEYFRKACDLIYPYLIEYANSVIGSNMKHLINDIVSDTVLKMHDKTLDYYTHYNNSYYFDWCCSILRSIKYEYQRSFCKKNTIELTEEVFEYNCPIINEYDKEEEIKKETQLTVVHKILETLPKNKQNVLTEIYLKNKSYEDTSATLKMSISNVKYCAYSGKDAIKKEILKKYPQLLL
jgi:RNA polymerase sigma factor (sigma-70 family)